MAEYENADRLLPFSTLNCPRTVVGRIRYE